ncbi:MAG TPA: hypothetical protein VM260_22285, partial [Pirellula sp.]|nr:hypothetical protein [Pirellula sp.]
EKMVCPLKRPLPEKMVCPLKRPLELPWSNGQLEGQINRLKMIKREMYGRANLKLLECRVLNTS